MAFPRKTINVSGHDWSYIKIGEGKPLFLIHGILNYADYYLPIAQTLKENYEVIIPDLPGFGFTKRLIQKNTYKNIAFTLADFIRTLGYTNINVFGTSMGGIVGLELAEKHPELIKKLIIHSAPWRKNDIKLNQFESHFMHHVVYNMPGKLGQIFKDKIFTKALPYVMPLEGIKAKEVYDRYHEKIDESISLLDFSATVEAYESLENIETIPNPITVETIVMVSDQDEHIEVEEDRKLADQIKAKKFVVVENSTHSFIMEDGQKAANLIHDFVK